MLKSSLPSRIRCDDNSENDCMWNEGEVRLKFCIFCICLMENFQSHIDMYYEFSEILSESWQFAEWTKCNSLMRLETVLKHSMEKMKIDLKCLEDFLELFNTIVHYNANHTQVQCAKVLIAKIILSNLYIWNCTTGAWGKHFRRNVYRFLRKFKTEDAMSCDEVGKRSERRKVERIIRTGREPENPEKWGKLKILMKSRIHFTLLLSLSLCLLSVCISEFLQFNQKSLIIYAWHCISFSFHPWNNKARWKPRRRRGGKKLKTRKCRLWYENFPLVSKRELSNTTMTSTG